MTTGVCVAGHPYRNRPDQVVQPVLRRAKHQYVGLVLVRKTGQLTGRVPDAGGDMDVQADRRGSGQRVGEFRTQPGKHIGLLLGLRDNDHPRVVRHGDGVMSATSSGRPVRRARPVAHASARRLAVDPS